MTVPNVIDVKTLNEKLTNLKDRADNAGHPAEWGVATEINEIIGDACDSLIDKLIASGFKADNCDQIRAVEAVLLGYVLDSNPDENELIAACGPISE